MATTHDLYLLRTFSICFCWNLPFMMSWLFPSMAPLVPSSANRKANRCCRGRHMPWYIYMQRPIHRFKSQLSVPSSTENVFLPLPWYAHFYSSRTLYAFVLAFSILIFFTFPPFSLLPFHPFHPLNDHQPANILMAGEEGVFSSLYTTPLCAQSTGMLYVQTRKISKSRWNIMRKPGGVRYRQVYYTNVGIVH